MALSRRARIVWWSFGGLTAVASLLIAGALVFVETRAGQEWIRKRAISSVARALEGRGSMYLGRVEGSLGGRLVVDSLALLDEAGRVIAAASRLEANGSLAGFLWGDVRLRRLFIVRPYLLLELRDSTWNLQRLFPGRPGAAAGARGVFALAIDSAEVRDGRVVLVTPDTLERLPPVRHELTGVQIALGPTIVSRTRTAGGAARVPRLSAELSLPRLSLREAAGTVWWWPDSLSFDVPVLRLPASRGEARGTVTWAGSGATRLDVRARVESDSLEDVSWVSPLLPRRGRGSVDLHIRNSPANAPDIAYGVSNLDLRATKSRLTGAFTAAVGRRVAITDLALEAAPLDLDLVREIFGDTVLKPGWRGALSGVIRGRGGPLEALQLDDVRLTYDDHRVSGARSRLSLAGQLDARAVPTELRGVVVRLEELDVRTLGVIARTADSLRGVLTGSFVLDGPTRDVRFRDLVVSHVDSDRARSRVSGEGRLASDGSGRWFDATLALDTIAVATLARAYTTLPLTGVLRGALELHATGDTMTIDAHVQAGHGGTARFRGATLVDSTRTWLRGRATLAAVDPRALIKRKEIPALRLDGTATVEVDANGRRVEAHVDLTLDPTSVIGESPVTSGRVRLGVDSTGLHVDTAEIRTTAWRVDARGRLARTGASHDTLDFAVAFDSLGSLRALLLDSAGTARADSVRGALGARGVLVGSFDTLAVRADFGLAGARWGRVGVDSASGSASLAGLPNAATGTVTLAARRVALDQWTASAFTARADVREGQAARVAADLTSGHVFDTGDTLRARLVGDVAWSGDTTRLALDSLGVALGPGRWRLEGPAHITRTPERVRVDTTTLRSALGATVWLHATLPESGEAAGALRVTGLTPAEFAFAGIASRGLAARANAELALAGSRDSPLLTFDAGVDSVSVRQRAAPSLRVTGRYEDRRAHLDLRGVFRGREVASLSGSVPMNLALREVDRRFPDDSLNVRVRADAASLAGLEAFLPEVEGLGGALFANVDVGGTWARPVGRGAVLLRDGVFDFPRAGAVGRGLFASLSVAGDSAIVDTIFLHDGNPRNTISARGAIWRSDATWRTALTSEARNFTLMDDPRVARVHASWRLRASGGLKEPRLEGEVTIPAATFVLGAQRRVRRLRSESGLEEARLPFGMPILSAFTVTLGDQVRLRSREANVQLSGALDVAGELSGPYVSGEIQANRGTYRVDLGVLKRTFRVDSGTVRVNGTPDMPAALDLFTSYVVRSAERDDVNIEAHVTGTTETPRLQLFAGEAGSTMAQSEIISYLIFGSPSFALDGQGQSTVRTATAALVPSLGGVLEGVLGTLLPFLSSLQVTTVAGTGPRNLTTNPLDGLLNSFALTAGRQVGTDAFLNLSAGVCRGSRVSSTQSAPGWFGVAAEYRPRNRLGAVIAVDPGSAPCNRVGRFSEVYQFGLDLFRDWRF